MVTFLPEAPSFGSSLGKALGGGISQGMSRAHEFAQQMAMEKAKQKALMDILSPQQQPQIDMKKEFLEALPVIEQSLGRELTPSDLDAVWERLQGFSQQPQTSKQKGIDLNELSPEQEIALGQMNPALSRVVSESKKRAQKQASESTSRAFSETKPYRERLEEQFRSAKDLDPILSQMENLIKRGKLSNPVIAKLADKFGLVGLLNPNSQQFQALSVGFLQNAKNIFGARVTNYDIQTYMDKIPRLAQTDAGKNALIDNFRALGKAAEVRNKVKNKIIKENNGIPPMNIEERVEERAAPELDKLFSEFNRSMLQNKSQSGKILMRHPNGALGEVPEDKVNEAVQKGYVLE